jgi:hypothetical protein
MLIASIPLNRIDDVMVSVLASSAIDCGFELWSGHSKDYKIGTDPAYIFFSLFLRSLCMESDLHEKWNKSARLGAQLASV